MSNQKTKKRFLALAGVSIGALVLAVACASAGNRSIAADSEAPFGGKTSVSYSKALWSALKDAKLVGKKSINTVPYTGQHPHGAILETLSSRITVNGHTGDVYVKKNYGGKGITRSKVANNRKKYLKAVTVMFKRESGYDSDNKNWFWVKFKPNGSLHKNPKGMLLAGRVAKGKKMGCISCHTAAPGKDYLFTNTAMQLDKK